jgi:hypothetical protein
LILVQTSLVSSVVSFSLVSSVIFILTRFECSLGELILLPLYSLDSFEEDTLWLKDLLKVKTTLEKSEDQKLHSKTSEDQNYTQKRVKIKTTLETSEDQNYTQNE